MKITRLDVTTYTAPVSQVVSTSFGQMTERSMALLRVEDEAGNVGWGEIWGNFPAPTLNYRADLAGWALPAHLIGTDMTDPAALCNALRDKLHVIRLQADEPGPVSGVIAATSQALWDLAARQQGVPLHQLLAPGSAAAMPAYASGLNPNDCVGTVAKRRSEGYRAWKLKIGFGEDTDHANLGAIRQDMQPGERLFVDANQRWSLEDAKRSAAGLEQFDLGWFEEPMPCDRPDNEWQELAASTSLVLAGGENINTHQELVDAMQWMGFIQPDVGKWGGVEGCFEIGRSVVAAGKTYCPHWLAGGVGLMHSAHLLAAVGGDGLLEIDSNENPLRSNLVSNAYISDGLFTVNGEPGIGLNPDEADIARFQVSHQTYA